MVAAAEWHSDRQLRVLFPEFPFPFGVREGFPGGVGLLAVPVGAAPVPLGGLVVPDAGGCEFPGFVTSQRRGIPMIRTPPGRNLRDLIDIVTTLESRGVGVQSLTNGIVDTTTAHGKLVFGMFALMAEYEAGLIHERTQAGLAARSRGHKGGRKPKMTASLIGKAQRMYDARQFTMAEIATSCGVTPMTIYRHIHTDQHAKPTDEPR